MNVQSIDLGDELRQGVHFCLDLAPVILCRPIARERLDRRELTPWDASVTVSRSGHFVALMRLRSSVSSASGKFTWNGRIAFLSAACLPAGCVALVWVMMPSFLGRFKFVCLCCSLGQRAALCKVEGRSCLNDGYLSRVGSSTRSKG